MTLIASCHCGNTTVTLPHPPVQAAECNCSFCSRTGAVWGYFKPGELQIAAGDSDKFYSASGPANEHHFCSHCGMQTFGVSPDWASAYNDDGTPKGDPNAIPEGQMFAVNLRLIDDFDWSSVTVHKMDGRNSW